MIPHLQLFLRALNTQLLIKTDKVGIDTPVSFSVLKKLKLDKVCNFVKLDLSEEYVLIVIKITIFPKVW
jgi:hypothetical protein